MAGNKDWHNANWALLATLEGAGLIKKVREWTVKLQAVVNSTWQTSYRPITNHTFRMKTEHYVINIHNYYNPGSETFKWRITIEKLYRKWTVTNFFFKNMTRQWDRTANLKRIRRDISHCASRQLRGNGQKRLCKAVASYSVRASMRSALLRSWLVGMISASCCILLII